MSNYFQGWRRKLGVVTLGLTCVLTAAWMMSFNIEDRIDIPYNTSLRTLASRRGYVDYRFISIVNGPHLTPYDAAMSAKAPTTDSLVPAPEGEDFEAVPIVLYHQFKARPSIERTRSSHVARNFFIFNGIPTIVKWRAFGVEYVVKRRLFSDQNRDHQHSEQFVLLAIPYWSIVTPLTLLSAYLLLSKPRPTKPMPSSLS